MEDMRNAYKILDGKSETKRRIESRGEYNTEMDVATKMWGCGPDSSGSGQGPVELSCEYGN